MMFAASANKKKKLVIEEIGISCWLPVLISVAGFLIYPVRLLVALNAVNFYVDEGQNYVETLHKLRVQTLASDLGSRDPFTSLALLIAAMLCAFTMFYYLDSREQTDFYHSLAFTRSQMYRMQFIAGWLSAAVPYVVNVLLAYFLAGGIHGLVSLSGLAAVLRSMLFFLLAFSAVYGVCVLAMILAGRLLIGILLSFFFLGYGPVCYFVTRGLITEHLQTYCSYADVSDWIGGLLSPFSVLLLHQGQSSASMNAVIASPAMRTCLLVAFLAGYLLLTWFLSERVYRRRPSETAGNAWISLKLGSVVKVMISIPAGVFLGALLSTSTDAQKISWIVFSLIIVILTNGVIEFIYNRDLRSITAHWISLVIEIGGAMALIGLLMVNPTSYDTWLPDADQVSSMAVISNTGIQDIGDYSYNLDGSENTLSLFDATETENIAPAYALARAGVAQLSENTDTSATYAQDGLVSVSIRFRLKSGSVKYRQYVVSNQALQEAENALSEDAAWREKVYPANYIDPSEIETVTAAPWSVAAGAGTDLELSGKEIRELVQDLAADTNGMTVDTMQSENPIGVLEFTPVSWDRGITSEKDGLDITSLYIYPEMQTTLAFLQKHGITLKEQDDSGAASATEVISDIVSLNVSTVNDSAIISDTGDITDFLQHCEQLKQADILQNDSWYYLEVAYKGTADTRYTYIRPDKAALEILDRYLVSA
ncbi:MAG: DUF6449 domain-containing protein [Bilifractor sp.]